ncbi:MAG: TonB-dependent siderophore receptor [Methylovulum sp.]|nr:TonB-dependent siderophore receptor [Methylovulum sp.]
MDIFYKNGWLPAVVTTLQLCLPFPAIAAETADEATLPTVTVKAAAKAKPPAVTKGYVAERSSSATKTNTPLLETPQAISVITTDELNAHKVQTLTDAVAYTPGVRVGAFGYDPRFDSFSIRGFDATYAGIYRDGLRQLSSNFAIYKEEPYSAERVEVLKGPGSVLYGQAEPGGLVNITTKRPSFEARREVEAQFGNYDRKQGRFDFTGVLNDGDTLAYRLTGLFRDSKSPIPAANDDRIFIAPAWTWKPDDKTTLTVLTYYQSDKTVGNPSYFNQNGKVRRDLPAGDAAFQDFIQDQFQVGYLLEHKLNGQWSLCQNLRIGRVDADARYTDISEIIGTVATRYTGRLVENFETYALDNHAQWQGRIGQLDHTVLFGLDWTHSFNNGRMGFGSAPDLDLTTLNYGTQTIDSPVLDMPYQYRMSQVGLYLQDQLHWQQWRLTLGGRHDWADTSQTQDGLREDGSDTHFSGRVGLGYLFSNGLSPYLSYSTSFVPVVGKNADGGFFKPTTGEQIEAGLKYQPSNSHALITASLFQITQENVKLASGLFTQMQAGEIRSRGFELEAKADVNEALHVTAAYTYLSPEFTSRKDDNYGNTLSSIPEHTVSVWGDYTLPAGVLHGAGIGAGVRYLGSSMGDDENTFKNSRVALLDMALHYEFMKHWRLAINANNLTGEDYSTCAQGYCYLGQARTVIGSLRYVW